MVLSGYCPGYSYQGTVTQFLVDQKHPVGGNWRKACSEVGGIYRCMVVVVCYYCIDFWILREGVCHENWNDLVYWSWFGTYEERSSLGWIDDRWNYSFCRAAYFGGGWADD